MPIFTLYILGALISGLIFNVLIQKDTFYNMLCKHIDKSKNDLKDNGTLNDTERVLLDGLSNDSVINYLNWFITLLSWIGLVIDIMYMLIWAINPKE